MDTITKYLVEIGRRGGQARTTAKVNAARENLKKARAKRAKKNLKKSLDK